MQGSARQGTTHLKNSMVVTLLNRRVSSADQCRFARCCVHGADHSHGKQPAHPANRHRVLQGRLPGQPNAAHTAQPPSTVRARQRGLVGLVGETCTAIAPYQTPNTPSGSAPNTPSGSARYPPTIPVRIIHTHLKPTPRVMVCAVSPQYITLAHFCGPSTSTSNSSSPCTKSCTSSRTT